MMADLQALKANLTKEQNEYMITLKELEDALDAPAAEREAALGAAVETAVRRTRSFARRQRMWFRRDPRITWFGATAEISDVEPALLAWWGLS